ncbi:PDZ domain-containing RING finger protein 4 [Photinus pyralis]|uniref:PDZ domain-containing RING finger protein 4 n=1 Tax=Photinus pyralis TaxID=7054 RepID=UPI001267618D|nr:PDZ domain-containing RING finger protein 4 [Photinus pyralis]
MVCVTVTGWCNGRCQGVPRIPVEVTLRKCNGNEKLGLTVCYSSGSDVDTYTEVYIQNIAPNSVAHCDGRLREGDQILQVNGKDVTNKEETESLFAENPKAVTLLVSRCPNQNEKEAESPTEFLTSSPRSVAYQNSLIEQLVQQQSVFEQSHTRDVPMVPPHLQLNLTNSLIRSQMYMINHEISELDKRMQNIQLVKRDKFKSLQLPSESDSEHIYETIPESLDSTLEPIYSCPYESQENINLQLFVTEKQDSISKEEKTNQSKNAQSVRNNSNEEEHDNSSSAYNTGGSCNSNLLTVELSYGLNSNQRDNYRSTLVLYAPSEEEKSKKQQESNDNCDLCEVVTLKPNKNKTLPTKTCNAPTTSPITKPDLNISDFLSDTMYTNVANLQQTILLQQQLFRQALGKQSNGTICKPTTSFTTPSLSQYQFVNCPQTYKAKDTKMEWKVKRRSDGTRYIARRPVRNRILRNRALRISEERAGVTTEDDTISEFKMGKYWKKEERKKHLERSKERKQRQENTDGVYQKPFEKVHSSATKKNIAENTNKKHKPKRTNKEEYHDFTAVQEMLMHGPQVLPNSNSKIMGLLSVTTV